MCSNMLTQKAASVWAWRRLQKGSGPLWALEKKRRRVRLAMCTMMNTEFPTTSLGFFYATAPCIFFIISLLLLTEGVCLAAP